MGLAEASEIPANWMITCGKLVQPLVNLLSEQLQQQPIVHMDETTVQVLAEPGRDPRSKLVLLRNYLEQGISKAELARKFGVSPRTVYHWIETDQLESCSRSWAMNYPELKSL